MKGRREQRADPLCSLCRLFWVEEDLSQVHIAEGGEFNLLLLVTGCGDGDGISHVFIQSFELEIAEDIGNRFPVLTAAGQISPLVDYADLDGNTLLERDPFNGMRFDRCRLILPEGPGLGVQPAD